MSIIDITILKIKYKNEENNHKMSASNSKNNKNQNNVNANQGEIKKAIHVTLSEDLDNQIDQLEPQNFLEQKNQKGQLQKSDRDNNQLPKNQDNQNILLQVLKIYHKDKVQSQVDKKSANVNQKQYSMIPEPLSSDEEQSQEAQYLSYLQNTFEPNQSYVSHCHKKREKLSWSYRREFLTILYQCMVYVRKGQYRTKIDDELLADRISQFLTIGMSPNGKNQIGEAMMANGYCLVAYAILMGRVNSSTAIINYLFQNFKLNQGFIQDNLQEFQSYSNQPVQFFNLTQNSAHVTDALTRSKSLKRRNLDSWKQDSIKDQQNQKQIQNINVVNGYEEEQRKDNKESTKKFNIKDKMKQTKDTSIAFSERKKSKDCIGMKFYLKEGSPHC